MGRYHTIGPDGSGNIFNPLFTDWINPVGDFILNLIIYRTGNKNAARIGQIFQSSGDVDPVTIEPSTIFDHVAQIDADSKMHLTLPGKGLVAVIEDLLDIYGASQGIDHTREFGQQIVPRGIDYHFGWLRCSLSGWWYL